MQTDTVNSPEPDLEAMLASLPARHELCSLGVDIDAANVMLLDPNVDQEDKKAQFRHWASRYQPCMFGRLGAGGIAGIHYDPCSTRLNWPLHRTAHGCWQPAIRFAICSWSNMPRWRYDLGELAWAPRA